MSLEFRGSGVGDFVVKGVYGQKSILGHQTIQFAIDVRLREQPREETIYFEEVCFEVSLADGFSSHFVKVARPVRAPIRLATAPRSLDHQESFEVTLTRAELDAMERLRAGGDLRLKLTFSAIARNELIHDRTVVSKEHVIPQSDWIAILNNAGYSSAVLLEVPFVNGAESFVVPLSCKHLAEAHRAFLRGDWREAIGKCRDSLEKMQVDFGLEKIEDGHVLIGDARSMNKIGLLSASRRALHVFMNSARHSTDSGFDYTREDARFAICGCANLVAVLSGARL